MAKPRLTYAQVLEKISVPVDIDRVKACRVCGELMHLIRVNKLVVFWVHKGETVETCAKANKMYPGHPMISDNRRFYVQMAETWNLIMSNREAKKVGGNPKN